MAKQQLQQQEWKPKRYTNQYNKGISEVFTSWKLHEISIFPRKRQIRGFLVIIAKNVFIFLFWKNKKQETTYNGS